MSVSAISCNETIVDSFYCQFVFMISMKMLLLKVKADVVECRVFTKPKDIYVADTEERNQNTITFNNQIVLTSSFLRVYSVFIQFVISSTVDNQVINDLRMDCCSSVHNFPIKTTVDLFLLSSAGRRLRHFITFLFIDLFSRLIVGLWNVSKLCRNVPRNPKGPLKMSCFLWLIVQSLKGSGAAELVQPFELLRKGREVITASCSRV